MQDQHVDQRDDYLQASDDSWEWEGIYAEHCFIEQSDGDTHEGIC